MAYAMPQTTRSSQSVLLSTWLSCGRAQWNVIKLSRKSHVALRGYWRWRNTIIYSTLQICDPNSSKDNAVAKRASRNAWSTPFFTKISSRESDKLPYAVDQTFNLRVGWIKLRVPLSRHQSITLFGGQIPVFRNFDNLYLGRRSEGDSELGSTNKAWMEIRSIFKIHIW